MMSWVRPLHKISKPDIPSVGGKSAALSRLIAAGFKVPAGLAVTTEAFDRFVEFNGLKGTIALEVHRKREDQLRWEEIVSDDKDNTRSFLGDIQAYQAVCRMIKLLGYRFNELTKLSTWSINSLKFCLFFIVWV